MLTSNSFEIVLGSAALNDTEVEVNWVVVEAGAWGKLHAGLARVPRSAEWKYVAFSQAIGTAAATVRHSIAEPG